MHPVKDLTLGLPWLLVVFLTKQYVTISSWDRAESAFINGWIHSFGLVIHLPSWHLLQSYNSSEGFHNDKLVFVLSCKKQNSWEEGGRNISIPISKKSTSWYKWKDKLAISFKVILDLAKDKKLNTCQNISGGLCIKEGICLSSCFSVWIQTKNSPAF